MSTAVKRCDSANPENLRPLSSISRPPARATTRERGLRGPKSSESGLHRPQKTPVGVFCISVPSAKFGECERSVEGGFSGSGGEAGGACSHARESAPTAAQNTWPVLMPSCNVCGEPIVFRYVDGQPKPIHINGNWCRGYRGALSPKAASRRRPVASYAVNATCPVCAAPVFYYQAPNGGRVFFDDLGWPWPKHPCTDNNKKVRHPAKTKRQLGSQAFRGRDGSQFALHYLDVLEESGRYVKFIFRQPYNRREHRKGFLRPAALKKAGLKRKDFRHAPFFVVNLDKSDANGLRVDFICARLGRIVQVRMSKARS